MKKHKSRDDLRTIENILRKYRQYKVGIQNLSRQIEMWPKVSSDSLTSERSYCLSIPRSGLPDDCMSEPIEPEVADLRKKYYKYTLIVESIDQSLEELSEIEKTFIEYRYFQMWSIRRISIEIGYSESSVHVIRRTCLKKLSISLSGIVSFCL